MYVHTPIIPSSKQQILYFNVCTRIYDHLIQLVLVTLFQWAGGQNYSSIQPRQVVYSGKNFQ